jgi:hypothetical protein
MTKEKDPQTRRILTGFSSKPLVGFTEKTPHAVLSEQFLACSFERTTEVIQASGKFVARARRLLFALSFVPPFFLLSFMLPPGFGDFLMRNETFTRLSTGFVIGLCLFASFGLSDLGWKSLSASLKKAVSGEDKPEGTTCS